MNKKIKKKKITKEKSAINYASKKEEKALKALKENKTVKLVLIIGIILVFSLGVTYAVKGTSLENLASLFQGKSLVSFAKAKQKTEENTSDLNNSNTISEFAKNVDANGIKTGDKVEIKDKSNLASVYAVSLGDSSAVPVPYGFYYVGGTLDTGVIISDNSADAYVSGTDKTTHSYAPKLKGNQFVWIPCSAANYKKTTWADKQYQYNTIWTRDIDDAGYEQCQKYGGFYIARYEAGVATFSSSGTLTNSVTFANGYTLNGAVGNTTSGWNPSSWQWWWQNKNFCARGNYPIENDFGTNYATGNVVFKANSIPYYHADYYTGCEMARRLYSGNNYVYCGLVTGAQWDVMVNKINSATGADISSNSNWGNYSNQAFTSTGYGATVNGGNASSWDGNGGYTSTFSKMTSKSANTLYLMTTGSSSSFLKYGLYDVAGNLWEWTKEPIQQTDDTTSNDTEKLTYYYTRRGGCAHNGSNGRPACYRDSDYVADTLTSSRFSIDTIHIIKSY